MNPDELLQLKRSAAAERLRLNLTRDVLRSAIHEMNNPITGVVNLSQLIADRLPLDHPLRPLAETAVQECNRIAGFTRLLGDFSSEIDPAFVRAAVSVTDLVEKALRLYARPLQLTRVQTKIEIDAALVYLNGRGALHGLLHVLGFAVQSLAQRTSATSAAPQLTLSGAPTPGGQYLLQIAEPDAIAAEEYREPADSADECHLGVAAAREFLESAGGRLALFADPGARVLVRVQTPLFNPTVAP